MARSSSSFSCPLAFSRVDVTELIDPLVENSLRLAAVSSYYFRSSTISLEFTLAVNSCTDKSVYR